MLLLQGNHFLLYEDGDKVHLSSSSPIVSSMSSAAQCLALQETVNMKQQIWRLAGPGQQSTPVRRPHV